MYWLVLTGKFIIDLVKSKLIKGEKMKVKIGERIKRLRVKRGLTQENLSEILDISPQAISRWENNLTYPNLDMVASIATFFNVSVDELLAMDELRSKEQISKIHTYIHKLIEEGNVDEAIDELRNSLKLYPNDYEFMCELALALTFNKDCDISSKNVEEVIYISERILDSCIYDKIRSTTKANLCFVYLKSGNVEKAIELGKTLPHVWESQEFLLPEINNLGVDKKKLKQGIITTLNVIYSKVNCINDKSNTGRMLVLGPGDYKNINLKDKLNVITDYLYQD